MCLYAHRFDSAHLLPYAANIGSERNRRTGLFECGSWNENPAVWMRISKSEADFLRVGEKQTTQLFEN